jgi:hypothetical protein
MTQEPDRATSGGNGAAVQGADRSPMGTQPPVCPERPELRAPQRAKVLLILDEGQQTWVPCWAFIDGPWVLFLDDEDSHWVSYPLQHIRCVEWQYPEVGDE